MSDSQELSTGHDSEYLELLTNKSFLGREFLTWLWYFSEQTSGLISLPVENLSKSSYSIDLWVEDRLIFHPSNKSGHESLLRGGDPSKSEEARIALQTGKTVKELKLGLHVDGFGDFAAVLESGQITPRSLQLPNRQDDNVDELGPVAMRIESTQIFMSILDGLFHKFLEIRSSSDWKSKELKSIQSWINSENSASHSSRLH